MNSRKLFVLLVVLISSILITAPVQAGRPETGDTAKAAYKVDINETLTVTVGERTEVWFRYRDKTGGLVQVATCPTPYDTVIDAYTGSHVSPQLIGHANDDDYCTLAADAMWTFPAERGKAYYFKVTQLGGGSPASGTTLTFSISPVAAGLP